MRRLMLKMSQEGLGDALGITLQQVQKYEKGMNRISAGRLHQIAQLFSYFRCPCHSSSRKFQAAPMTPLLCVLT